MTTDKNPRAFPCGEGIYEPGMTLRDYFAAAALPTALATADAITTNGSTEDMRNTSRIAADFAYRIADRMLEAREK